MSGARGKRRWVVPAASVAVALVALGVGAYVTWYRQAHRVASDVITRTEEELGRQTQVMLPALEGRTVWIPDRPHNPEEMHGPDRMKRFGRKRSFKVSTNSLGMRGPEPATPAPAGRVVCAGDSITFGWGVRVHEAYPALLARLLEVEVLNGARPAAAPWDVAAWVRQQAPRLKPALVLFVKSPAAKNMRDPVDNYVKLVQQAAAAVRPARLAVVLPPLSTFAPHGDRTGAHARQIAARLRPIPVLDLTPIFRARQKKLTGVLGKLGPQRQQILAQPSGRVMLEAEAPPTGGLAPEVGQFFERHPKLSEPLIFDGGHPDVAGHRLMAAAITVWIREQGLAR